MQEFLWYHMDTEYNDMQQNTAHHKHDDIELYIKAQNHNSNVQ